MKRDSNKGDGGKKREACRDSGGRNLLTGMPMDFQEVDQLFSKVGFIVSFTTTTEVVHLERGDRDRQRAGS